MAEPSTTETERIAREMGKLYSGDRSNLDVVAESVDIYHPAMPGGAVHSRDEFEAFLDELSAGFPDFEVTIGELLVGDDVAMMEMSVRGTHEGEYQGIEPTGRQVDLECMTKVVVRDGKVRESRTYYNRQKALEQLGLTGE